MRSSAILTALVLLALRIDGAAARDQGSFRLSSGATLDYRIHSKGITIAFKGKSLLLPPDSSLDPNSPFMDFQLIGESDSAILSVEEYASKVSGPRSYCGAGTEKFLRVISLAPQLRETLRLTLESCLNNIELVSSGAGLPSGLSWDPPTATLTIHWMSGPSHAGAEETRRYHIERDGRAALVQTKDVR